ADLDEVRDPPEHPSKGRGVLMGHALTGPLQAQRLEGSLRRSLLADGALVLADLQAAHETATGSSVVRRFARSRPRASAIVSAERSAPRASIVAMTTFTGFVLPSDFERMSWMPADSTTARTEPPAITPVPFDAGRRRTFAAPKSAVTGCGIVRSTSGTSMRCFLASSTPFLIASGTSSAFPRPAPTWPRPSPTTTMAEKLNRRPPFTTFDTRLI